MKDRRVRWGILGCGRIAAKAFAPAIHWSAHGDLLAVASRTLARARERADAVSAPRAHGSYEALLDDPDIDAVYIGLPNGAHASWAMAAAEAGKHVLCDKSLTLSDEDARSMREASRSRGLRLVEAFMVRHHPQWTLLRRLLDEQAVGTVRHVQAIFRARLDRADDHRWSRNLGGGALFDVGCYAVNAARFVTREEPIRAHALSRWASPGVDLATDGLLLFPSGVIASVHGSLDAPFEQQLVVSGDGGRIVMPRPFIPHWDPTEVIVERGDARETHAVGGANHFLHLVEHVEQCILDPSLDLFPAEDGVDNVAACNLLRQASTAARP